MLRDAEEAELERLQAELAELGTHRLAPALPDLDTVLAEVGGWDAALRGPDVAERRAVLAALVDRVVPARLGHDAYAARVTWTPAGDALRAALARAGRAEKC